MLYRINAIKGIASGSIGLHRPAPTNPGITVKSTCACASCCMAGIRARASPRRHWKA
jgi:hypothetical protein